jgi:HJR/Mrr/RecB family endonuclease
VIYSDLLFCILFGIASLGFFSDLSSQGYHNPFYIYLFLALLANFIVDLWLLKNKKHTPGSIDIRICWIKGLIGILGIFTVISGLYFIINSVNMHNSYNDYIAKRKNEEFIAKSKRQKELDAEIIRKETEETQNRVKAKFQETEDNIKRLEKSGNINIVDNYAKIYPNRLSGTKEFNNLKELLTTKKYYFENNDLELIIHRRKTYQKYSEIKQKILERHPNNSDECILYYLELVGNHNEQINESMIHAILNELFDYQGDIYKDIARISKECELKKFESNLISGTQTGTMITINHIDRISGYDFEKVLEGLFEKMGYKVTRTTLSNDQGADLIVEKFGEKTVIQAKNWQNNVSNSAIQEVVAAIKHYNAQKSMVISSSGFTTSAIELARSNNVELWDRTKLNKMLNDNPIFFK